MATEVGVGVVTYNSADLVDALLDSVPAACDGLSWETVVVDNGSTDATPERVARRGDCRVVEAANDGYAAGVNKAVAATTSRFVLVANPDVVLAPGSVSELVRAADETGAGIVVPRLESPDGRLQHSLRRDPTLPRSLGLASLRHPALSEHVSSDSEYAVRRDVDWATGAVMLVSRACLDRVGPWDESYFLYSEETDFCLRARDAGYRVVYEPAARAAHVGGGSGRSHHTHAMQALNQVRLYRRRRGALLGWLYYATVVAKIVGRGVAGDRAAWPILTMVLRPSRRPEQLGLADRLLPG
jgi:GT2 family glycosyltransferase